MHKAISPPPPTHTLTELRENPQELETYGLGIRRLKLDQFGKSRAFSTQYE